jgi:hypothetical protein
MVTSDVAYHPLETLDERARTLAELSEILTEIGSDHALIGGIAVGYHGRLRATVDVDLLVPRGKLEPLAHALRARGYVITETRDMVRVYPPAANPRTPSRSRSSSRARPTRSSRQPRVWRSRPRCSGIACASSLAAPLSR